MYLRRVRQLDEGSVRKHTSHKNARSSSHLQRGRRGLLNWWRRSSSSRRQRFAIARRFIIGGGCLMEYLSIEWLQWRSRSVVLRSMHTHRETLEIIKARSRFRVRQVLHPWSARSRSGRAITGPIRPSTTSPAGLYGHRGQGQNLSRPVGLYPPTDKTSPSAYTRRNDDD